VVVQKHIDDKIQSLEQIIEAINSGIENIKEQYMNNSEQQRQREHSWQ
jgi:septation ring formation regulator EzrA